MIKTISRMFFTYGIISIFFLTNLTPLAGSITFYGVDSGFPSLSSLETSRNVNDRSPSLRHPDGLASTVTMPFTTSKRQGMFSDRGHFYAFCVSDPSGTVGVGLVTFDIPEDITLLGPGVFPNFCGGADIDNNGNWYGCDYAGGLYLIDLENGITYIAPTIGVNGMTYDPTTETWYISSSNSLYTIDVSTGATTLIGSHGITNTIIGIACNLYGDMYGYDVLWTGDSTLYSINKTTGAATAIGDMGYGFVYAQDFSFDRDDDILYVAGYFNNGSPSALLTCDVTTGECSIVGYFEGGVELDALVIPWNGITYDHDAAITGIVKPFSGNAGPITPVVNVKNAGNNTETNVPIQLVIGKEQITGTIEDFEATNGSYIHFMKNTDSWQWGVPTSGPGVAYSGSNLWATILNGNYPSSMWSGLKTQPLVVPSGAMFKFWHWYQFESGWDGGNVKISADGGTTFTLITPVGGYPGTLSSNPYMTGQPGYTGTGGTTWAQAVFDLSAYEGMTVVILWETASDTSVQYAGWYIDDVGFTETSWVTEYNQTTTIASIAPQEVIELSFPTWTPGDLGLVENNNINYNVEATAMLVGDQNLNNDYKEKAVTLHYGYFHDVAVTQIVSPISGLAQTQTPKVTVENHGQYPENMNVSMTIGKALYTTLLEEDFAGSMPPAGWGTNYPSNWMSSSTNYAGGESPEASFSWSPSSVGEHYLWTGVIDTTGYTALSLKFKEYVNDYNGGYTLKVVTSTDGGATWNTAYTRAGGSYGPTTTTITLSAANGVGSATFQVAWDMSGDSFNINYWYIDDVWMGIIDFVEEYNQTVSTDISPGETLNVLLPDWTPADIPFATTIDYLVNTFVSMNTSDGKPEDNHLATVVTLTYEHDMGTSAITEPFSEPIKRDEGWLQYDNGVYANAFGSTTGHIYGANRFTLDEQEPYIGYQLDMIRWKHYGDVAFSGVVHVYGAGTSSTPGPEITSEPFSITGEDWFEVPLTTPVTLDGSDIWLCVEGTHNTGDYPLECSEPGISLKTAFFSSDGETWYDLPSLGYDIAFEIRGYVHTNGGEYHYLYPGTYPIEGIIKNYGIIYSETDIPVNTIVTNEVGMIVYDETVIIPGPLDPGQTAIVSFPDITIPNEPYSYGDHKLTMKTILPDDDHPNNDRKIVLFTVEEPGIPPQTYATLSGTMGDNDWYVSCVTVTLSATDGKWPPGVNHTFYKVDNGEWTEYTTPIIVCDDGHHTVYFYSVYTDGSTEEEKHVTFKIDQTPPSIEMSVEEVNFHEWVFTANVKDSTSGIALVQCFIDDLLLGNITSPGQPYQWFWNGKGDHTVEGIAYDKAGNSAESVVTFSLSHDAPPHPFLSRIIERFMRFLERLYDSFPFLSTLFSSHWAIHL